jgi:protocatechuate 3,4-dioxygenase, beta subunit
MRRRRNQPTAQDQRIARRVVLGALAALPTIGLPATAWAQGAVRPTPRQTLGPFYPRNAVERPRDTDADLINVVDGRVLTLGTPLFLTGRILDASGRPLPDAAIEIWQCDANSVYHHPAGGGEAARDPNFQGYGLARSDERGVYRFRTILPVAYPGRTAHIHVRVAGPRTSLATQLYLAGEPGNERDFLYRQLDAAERAAITLAPTPTSGVEHPLAQHTRLTMRADLVLG